jgi:beta-mannosidase
LVAVNDTDSPWTGQVSLRRVAFDGVLLASSRLEIAVEARSLAVLALSPDLSDVGDVTGEVLVADIDGLRATHLFAEDKSLVYSDHALTASAAPIEGGYAVTVTATSFARDVAVLADRVAPDAVVDDMLISLLPGETHTFTVLTAAAVAPAAFTDPLVLRSALGAR